MTVSRTHHKLAELNIRMGLDSSTYSTVAKRHYCLPDMRLLKGMLVHVTSEKSQFCERISG